MNCVLVKIFNITPAYLAPEILNNKIYYGFSSDIWSFGIVVYALIFSELPFKGKNVKELMKNIREGNFYCKEWKNKLANNEKFRNILENCLSFDTEKRINYKEYFFNDVNKVEENFITLKEKFLLKVVKFGYPEEFVVKNVCSKFLSHCYACYCLIYEEKQFKI